MEKILEVLAKIRARGCWVESAMPPPLKFYLIYEAIGVFIENLTNLK